MLSVLIPAERGYPAVPLARQPVRRRFVQLGPLVLESDPRKFLTPTADRDRTVSRRSEPSSRATLMGEQPNPWDLLQPQDVTSRHRGAKPLRRYELLGGIPQIRELGTSILRIEAFAEPMYAASIVAAGVFHGAGDAMMPSILSFVSMWAIRIPLSAILAAHLGLQGVWIAMCVELCVRGLLFLIRLRGKRWLRVLK